MTTEEITILRVRKATRDKIRSLAIAKKESYDEILNRVLGQGVAEQDDGLEELKQKLLKKGAPKRLVNLIGVMPHSGHKSHKEEIREAIWAWASKKGMVD